MSPVQKPTQEELLSDFKILELENQMLVEREEELSLLQSLGDILYAATEISEIIQDVLERVSIFLDIPFCAWGRVRSDSLMIQNIYTLYSDEVSTADCVRLSPKFLKQLETTPQFLEIGTQPGPDIFFQLTGSGFEPQHVGIFPCRTTLLEQYLIIIADDTRQPARLQGYEKLIRVILSKIVNRLNNIDLMLRIESLNAELEDRVQQRTAELQASEMRYRELIETSIDGICTLDSKGNFLDINPAAQKLLGYSKSELLAIGIPDIVHHEDRAKSAAYLELLKTKGFYQSYEGRIVTKAGEIKNVQVNSTAFYKDGELAGSHDILRDVTERVLAEEKLAANLDEKGILLQEIQHRTKNNMMVIIALLNMQAAELDSPELGEAFKVTQQRIYSMSLVYDQLQRSNDFTAIDLKEYIQALSIKLHSALVVKGERIQINVECASVPISLTQAVPVGIILNELITNSLKHGFPDGRSGQIQISGDMITEKKLRLVIADNGVGVPADSLDETGSSLGLRLVQMLVSDQLIGTHTIATDTGLSHTLEFELI